MIEDKTCEVPQDGPDGAQAPKMDRRSFLLALSGGALALTATGLLAGCGGGGTNGVSTGGFSSMSSSSSSSSSSGSAQPFSETLPLPTGQSGALALTIAPGGSATGTLTVSAASSVRPRTLSITIPPGVYTITGMVNLATGAFNLSTTVPGTGVGTGLVTLVGTLPTQTTAGSFTLTVAGPPAQTQNATIPALGNPGSFTTTTGTSPDVAGATRTRLLHNGSEIAYVDAVTGYPSFTLMAVGGDSGNALPSAATLPSGKTLVSPYIIKLALTGTLPANTSAHALVALHVTSAYTGPQGATVELSYLSDGTESFASGAGYGLGVANNVEALLADYQNGVLETSFNMASNTYGTTSYIGLFA